MAKTKKSRKGRKLTGKRLAQARANLAKARAARGLGAITRETRIGLDKWRASGKKSCASATKGLKGPRAAAAAKRCQAAKRKTRAYKSSATKIKGADVTVAGESAKANCTISASGSFACFGKMR